MRLGTPIEVVTRDVSCVKIKAVGADWNTFDEVTLRHPVYDLEALAAQKQAVVMNGTNRTWFCGVWMKNGFHEDGIFTPDEACASKTEPMRIAA